MGLLIIDHSGSGGVKQEFDTVPCKHCQAVIRVVIKGVKKAYETKSRCSRCHGPICNACASHMELNGGECNAPFLAKVEQALKKQRWQEHCDYHYKLCTGG